MLMKVQRALVRRLDHIARVESGAGHGRMSADVVPADIIGQNEHDVGPFGRFCFAKCGG